MTLGETIAQGRMAEIYPCGNNQVLKLFRDSLPDSWARQEAQVAEMVAAFGLPAPPPGRVLQVAGRKRFVS